jgi:hypothetical protein
LAIERLRYIAFSHFEADECGSLNESLPRRQVRRRSTKGLRR